MLNTGTPEFLQSSVGAQSISRALGVTGQAAVPRVYEKAWDVGSGAVLPNFPVRQDGFPFYDAPLSADVAGAATAGTVQTYQVPTLPRGAHYLAMRAVNPAGTLSALSSLVSAR